MSGGKTPQTASCFGHIIYTCTYTQTNTTKCITLLPIRAQGNYSLCDMFCWDGVCATLHICAMVMWQCVNRIYSMTILFALPHAHRNYLMYVWLSSELCYWLTGVKRRVCLNYCKTLRHKMTIMSCHIIIAGYLIHFHWSICNNNNSSVGWETRSATVGDGGQLELEVGNISCGHGVDQAHTL